MLLVTGEQEASADRASEPVQPEERSLARGIGRRTGGRGEAGISSREAETCHVKRLGVAGVPPGPAEGPHKGHVRRPPLLGLRAQGTD